MEEQGCTKYNQKLRTERIYNQGSYCKRQGWRIEECIYDQEHEFYAIWVAGWEHGKKN